MGTVVAALPDSGESSYGMPDSGESGYGMPDPVAAFWTGVHGQDLKQSADGEAGDAATCVSCHPSTTCAPPRTTNRRLIRGT